MPRFPVRPDSSSSSFDDTEKVKLDGPGLTQANTVSGLTISPELFERLYLAQKAPPANIVINQRRFANPAPLGLVGYVISTFTFAMVTMGWGGAKGLAGVAGVFFFVGPILMGLALIFEWIMGNFFSMMVQGFFTVFWLCLGFLELPSIGLAAAYSKTGDTAQGLASPEFNNVLALYCMIWGFGLLTFFVFTLKTNVIFASMFSLATIALWILAGAYWRTGAGDITTAGHLNTAAAALLFVVGLLGWYMIVVLMAAEMSFGISLPVGDLSRYWPEPPSTDPEKQ